MKHKILILSLTAFIVTTFVACDEAVFLTSIENDTPELQASTESSLLTQDELLYAANAFFKDRNSSRSSDIEIHTINDSLGEPAIHVVNYPNNGGFILLSAKKSHSPVLAFNTTGHFSIDEEISPLSNWVHNTSKKLFKFDSIKFLWQPNQSFLQRPLLILHNGVKGDGTNQAMRKFSRLPI